MPIASGRKFLIGLNNGRLGIFLGEQIQQAYLMSGVFAGSRDAGQSQRGNAYINIFAVPGYQKHSHCGYNPSWLSRPEFSRAVRPAAIVRL